jgi:hypothetical protein
LTTTYSLMGHTPSLIKPFTATVNVNGIAVIDITQNIPGLAWIVYQIGLALGKQAPSPQVAAEVNGVPLAATVTMQNSAFANISGGEFAIPYAMESFFVGPPYITLEAGDDLVVAVVGAVSGDTFTAGVYINEIISPASQAAKSAYAGS